MVERHRRDEERHESVDRDRGNPDARTERVERVHESYVERAAPERPNVRPGRGDEPTTVNVNAPANPGVPRQRPVAYGYAQPDPADRAVRFAWYLLGLIEGLLAIRIFLKLIGANPANPFASFIYSITAPLIAPFIGLVGSPRIGPSILELDGLIAMAVYILVFYAIVRLVELIFARPVA